MVLSVPFSFFGRKADLFGLYLLGSPMPTNGAEDFVGVLQTFALLFIFDKIIFRLCGLCTNDATGRYFSLHVMANAYVTVVHLKDIVICYQDPVGAVFSFCDTRGAIMVFSLHMYHIAFFQPLPMIDWVHHIVMVIVMLPLGYLPNPGSLLGHGCFFVSGFPGGVDYAMLVLVKTGRMASITEKRINREIQLWIRAPGCVFHSLLCWIGYCVMRQKWATDPTYLPPNCALPAWMLPFSTAVAILAFFWNGMYFADRVIDNFAERRTVLAMEGKKTEDKTVEDQRRGMVRATSTGRLYDISSHRGSECPVPDAAVVAAAGKAHHS
eukprot:gnl/Spiro4/5805_TR2961_c0_g1_i1.p1 gnl/Spiro4/5805_TR2961_c0_g1~~gnl/Spiro4/5805_TR2961_c0_g1_i1.p1  ORF type:complete len:340 (-),score=64.35 gnl/Spiro4/5805_TR2961_c0_g1_i1:37-1008(-)